MSQFALYICEEVADGYAGPDLPVLPVRSFGEDAKREFLAALSLRHTPGLGARSLAKLLKYFGSALRATGASDRWAALGVGTAILNEFKKESWRRGAHKEWEMAMRSDASLLLWPSRAYPSLLKELPDAPALLYLRGDASLFASPCVAIVGSRHPANINSRHAEAFARFLSCSGITIVSGMALGIDRHAHKGALEGIGKSIGVLGTGIDIRYPRSNDDLFAIMEKEGLLVSEFPPSAAPLPANFPVRNRLISGLSLGVAVIEAALRSGSLITARCALEQNREVFAVPGEAMSNIALGCQSLIRKGARAIFCPEDIISDLSEQLRGFGGPHPVAVQGTGIQDARGSQCPPSEKLSRRQPRIQHASDAFADEKGASGSFQFTAAGNKTESVRALLSLCGPLDMDKLMEESGLAFGELNAVILELELMGEIIRLPGARFEVKN